MFLKRFTSSLLAIFLVTLCTPISSASAEVLSLTKINFTQTSDIWTLTFSHDGSSLYFAENGAAGMHQILSSQLVSGGTAIANSSDGFSTFRTANPSWQNTTAVTAPTPGVSGHYWIYSGSGNINKPASPADTAGTTQSGVIWAIDTSNNSVSYINTKRSNGLWQSGQMYWLSMTPDGRYLYAIATKAGSPPSGGIELFKYSTATNTQVGVGVSGSFPWDGAAATNDALFFVTGSGILKVGIDADSATSTGDSAPSLMTLSGTASSFNFANANAIKAIDGKLYVTATDNTMAIIDAATGNGSSFTLTNTYNTGNFYSVEMGTDSCLYAYSGANKSINKINPNTQEVLASTGAITNLNPYWYNSFSMNPARTIYAISPKSTVNNGFYFLNISGTTCATGGGGSSGGNSSSSAESERKEAERKRQEAVQAARNVIVRKAAEHKEVTKSDLAAAEIGISGSTFIEKANKDLASLPSNSALTFTQVNQVISKYKTYEAISSGASTLISARDLVNQGILPKETPYKQLLLRELKQANPDAVNSVEKIDLLIHNLEAAQLARKAKLAATIARVRAN